MKTISDDPINFCRDGLLQYSGLTKLEYFTAMAMQAFIIAQPNTAMEQPQKLAGLAFSFAQVQMGILNH